MKRTIKRILMVPILLIGIASLTGVVWGGLYGMYKVGSQFFNCFIAPYGKYIVIAIIVISVCGYLYTLTDDIVD